LSEPPSIHCIVADTLPWSAATARDQAAQAPRARDRAAAASCGSKCERNCSAASPSFESEFFHPKPSHAPQQFLETRLIHEFIRRQMQRRELCEYRVGNERTLAREWSQSTTPLAHRQQTPC